MTGRYDEAVRLFDETDSMMRSNGDPVIDLYVKTLFNYKYEALQKAGRTAEALALGDRIRQLTDSIRQQERQADVEQLQEIKQQEEEIASKHQSLVVHRIILASAFLVCLLIAYLLWRSYKYNKVLTEKNRKLYEEIEQRRQEQQQEMELLQSAPEEQLTTEQQLFRRLCTLMDEQQPYTDETLNRDTLAQMAGTNEKYVEQAIRQCSKGETVSDFINRYRLEHVARLLKTTSDPIAIVGELSGIPSRATLARLFRNAYGMTPSEFRRAASAD
jgi:AraC-like DNA-binding protein